MKKTKNFFENRTGMYRIAFTICILFLSGLVVTITENKNVAETPVISEVESVEETIVTKIENENTNNELNTKKIISDAEAELKIKQEDEVRFEDASFSAPIYGKIQKVFSDTELIYSKTMDDWRIHEGIDIACDFGSEIYAAQDGLVTDIGYDLNFGNYIITQNGEYEIRYTSLSSDIEPEAGDIVYKGQLIGKVSDSCVSEICDEPHLHFEVKKFGEYVNPEEYILFE